VTSFQLALGAVQPATGNIGSSVVLFLGIFAVTQIPIAIVEGIVLALVFKYIVLLKPEILLRLRIFSEEKINAARGDE
jgi:cobalt/nickel transport system permease protein